MSGAVFHPLADLFPLLDGAELAELAADIKANGLRDPITRHPDGSILDGRNRYLACKEAGVEPRFETWDGKGTPEAFVVSRNLTRRHLTASQRAMIAERLANLLIGNRKTANRSDMPISVPEAAKMLNVSTGSVKNARTVARRGTPEEKAAVERGEAAVATVASQIRKGVPPEARKRTRDGSLSERGKNPERIQRQRLNAEIWGRLRDALEHLTNLPRAADVVAVAQAHDKSGLVEARVGQALQWLKDFEHEWRTSREDAA